MRQRKKHQIKLVICNRLHLLKLNVRNLVKPEVIGGGLLRDVMQHLTGSVVLGYTTVYITSLALLLTVVLLLVFRLGSQLRISEIRMPWSGVEEIPADQLTF